jgi:hypothetical protein
MQICVGHLVGFAAVAIGLLVTSTASAAAETRALTSLEFQEQFTQCGYQIGNRGSPSAGKYVVVRDPGASEVRDLDYRIVMAIVYPSETVATAEHQKAHREAEQRMDARRPFNNDNGPQLLAGYGGSVWRANVAMVQSSSRTLASMYSYDVQTDETRIARPDLFELGFVSNYREYGVDRDFVVCLESALAFTADSTVATTDATATGAASNTLIQPLFLPGQPW